ncbi:MAG: DUF4382 domain-containing protein [Planctomycetes bacterium]|nr:DUF4382 domain-containing protein [Planctomycetota bacterium]
MLLSDAPANELLAFQATIDDVRLVQQGGAESANLLAAPVTLELLSLQTSSAWLASQELPAGTYTGVHLSFTPGSYVARRNDGSTVDVLASSDDLLVSFATPITLGPGNYRRAQLDVDLANSLSGLLSAPPLDFAPQGFLSDDSGHVESSIDEIHGLVQSVSAQQNSLVMSAYVDDDSQVSLGDVQVQVGTATLLVQDNGSLFADRASFFASLTPGSSLLEVHGSLANGVVQATRIEVDDNSAGGGSANLVRLKGLVLGMGPGSTFQVSIISVPQGSSIVAAAFGGSIPGTLEVTYDGGTEFYLHEHQTTTSASLALGQKVDVKFSTFDNPPYLAKRVEIDDESGENEGTLTDNSGLPASFVMHLDESSPALLSGQVNSTSTDVAVDVGSASFSLDTQGHPGLVATDLLQGLRVRVHGPVSGTPSSPAISATGVEIRAGELRNALVNSVTPGQNASLTTFGGSIHDPFGAGVTDGPLNVLLAGNCVFTGDATTRTAFLELAQNPPVGFTLELDVSGIGSGTPNEIRAFEIDSNLHHN